MSPLLKNLVIALGITVVIGIVYYATLGDETVDSTDPFTMEASAVDAAVESDRIRANMQAVQAMNLEQRVPLFNEKTFTSLEDTRVPLTEITTGRSNPFAPVQ